MKFVKLSRTVVEEQFATFFAYPDEWNTNYHMGDDGVTVSGNTDSGHCVFFQASGSFVYWSISEAETEMLIADGRANTPQEAVEIVGQYA